MLGRLGVLVKKLRKKGFTGPYYKGLRGKVRFAVESRVARRELVFVLEPEDFHAVQIPSEAGFTVIPVASLPMLEAYRADLEALWYPGLLEGWRGPFHWGERLYLGLQDDRPISFNWLQVGTRKGASVYWGRVLEGEFRILRGGVAHDWRGKGVNTRMKHEIIRRVFSEGGKRVYAECYEANLPSVRTLSRLGFRTLGRLEVLEVPGLRSFVRWRGAP